MSRSELQYVALLYRASSKYASWDPEVEVQVGDWGRLTSGKRGVAFWRSQFWNPRGIFLKEGNIYKDGQAEEYDIPLPIERTIGSAHGITQIASNNAIKCDIEVAAQAYVAFMYYNTTILPTALHFD